MTHNVGITDRGFRILVGSIVLSLVFVGPQTAWGYVGLIPLLTGLFGTCPAYTILGLNTCDNRENGEIN